MTPSEVFASIAQGAINIDDGLTTIEAGSRVHTAMHTLCKLIDTDPDALMGEIRALSYAHQVTRVAMGEEFAQDADDNRSSHKQRQPLTRTDRDERSAGMERS